MVNYSAASYFRGSKSRTYTARKSGAIAKSRFKNKPVAKALATKPRKTIVKANRGAIYTLARQVRNLQLDQFGSRQYQYQAAQLTSSIPAENPLLTAPLLFLVNGFYNNSLIYQGSVAAGVPIGTALGTKLVKQDYDIDLKNQYQWNERNNQDQVSTTQYLPVYTKIKLTFKGKLSADTQQPVRFRITMLKLKNLSQQTVVKSMSLPSYLGAYWHMCDDNPTSRNYFSKINHEVIQDKYVSFKPPTGNLANETVFRTVELPYSFGKVQPVNMDKEQPDEAVWTNIAQKELLWLLISSNQEQDNGISIGIERQLIWRDKMGLAT